MMLLEGMTKNKCLLYKQVKLDKISIWLTNIKEQEAVLAIFYDGLN